MERTCQSGRGSLWWTTTDKGTSRSVIADIGKRITKLQGEHGLPCYGATVFEQSDGLHAHIVFVANRKIIAKLKAATAFGTVLQAEKAIKPVYDPEGLVRYLTKARTPQAGYRRRHVLGGRIRGSHPLEGGGDRVRLSKALELDSVEAGYVEPWQHTYARRTDKRKGYRLRNTGPLARAPRQSGQIPLLPEIERPVSRLHDFGGGIVPPAVAAEMEFHRQRLGLSQSQVGLMVGRSQGQYSNAIRGHDPISGTVVNRLRELLLPRLSQKNNQMKSNS